MKNWVFLSRPFWFFFQKNFFFASFLFKFITNQWVPRMGWNFDDYPLCSTLNSWIGELVVSFLDVTTRLLEGKECLKLKSFGRKFLPFNAWTVNMEFGGPFTIKFWKKRSNTNNESIYWHLEWDKLKNTFDKPSYSRINPVWIFPPFLNEEIRQQMHHCGKFLGFVWFSLFLDFLNKHLRT